jgi:hypothetical protein
MSLPASGGVLMPQMMGMIKNRELGKKDFYHLRPFSS